MRGLVALLALASELGCGGAQPCWTRGAGGSYEECKRMESYRESDEDKRARKAREQQKAEQLAQHQREERAKYDAAVEPCKRGEPEPCFVVGTYGMTHKHDTQQAQAAFEVACNGKIAKACFVRGELGGGVAWYERACTLDDVNGCLAAAAADKARAISFEARACELHDFAACERVGLAYADHDRVEAEKYLKLACSANHKTACRRLGELEVQP